MVTRENSMRLATWDDPSRTPDDGRVYEVLDSDLKMLAGGKTVQEVLEAYPGIELVRRSTPVTGQGVWAPCGW